MEDSSLTTSPGYETEVGLPSQTDKTKCQAVPMLFQANVSGERKTYLCQMAYLLMQMGFDATYKLLIEDKGIHRLMSGKEEMSVEDSEAVVNEIITTWPDLSNFAITAEEISQIAQSIRAGAVVVEYRLIRAFLVECCRQLRLKASRQTDDMHVETDNVAKKARDYVLLLSTVMSPAPVLVKQDAIIASYMAHADRFRAIADLNRDEINTILDGLDHQDIADMCSSVMEQVGVDSLKLYSQHRYIVNAINDAMEVEAKLGPVCGELLQVNDEPSQEFQDAVGTGGGSLRTACNSMDNRYLLNNFEGCES